MRPDQQARAWTTIAARRSRFARFAGFHRFTCGKNEGKKEKALRFP
jgi:hypothetical protein